MHLITNTVLTKNILGIVSAELYFNLFSKKKTLFLL